VLMDFTSESGCIEIGSRLKDGYQEVHPTCVRAQICSTNARRMCDYFALEHEQRAEKWRDCSYDAPPLLDVEHDCVLQHS
jgi:hypothetical protein